MFKSLLALALVTVSSVSLMAADGSLSFKAWEFQTYWDLEQTGNQVKGSMTNRGSPFVDLKKTEKDGWQGWFAGGQVASTKVTENKDHSVEVELSLLPKGFYTIRFAHKEKKGMFINGMTPNGRLISASFEHPKHDYSAAIGDTSLYLEPVGEGKYTGNAVVMVPGRLPMTSAAELKSTGKLELHALLHNDPALFALLFITTLD